MIHLLEVTHTLSYFWNSCLSLEKYFLPSRKGFWVFGTISTQPSLQTNLYTNRQWTSDLQNCRTTELKTPVPGGTWCARTPPTRPCSRSSPCSPPCRPSPPPRHSYKSPLAPSCQNTRTISSGKHSEKNEDTDVNNKKL